ncbi:MAG: CarD family transcriptional regulator [Oscillospiraceae bacterium]
MFRPEDLIIYGSSGVCRVAEVGEPTGMSGDRDKLYYKLSPVYSTETIFTPVDTGVFMRPVISRDEAEELVAQIPSIQSDAYSNGNLMRLREHYDEILQTHSCKALVEMIKSIFTKNEGITQNGKKLGQIDQRYWKRAEELLYGELAVALEIPRDDVVKYIETANEPTQ